MAKRDYSKVKVLYEIYREKIRTRKVEFDNDWRERDFYRFWFLDKPESYPSFIYLDRIGRQDDFHYTLEGALKELLRRTKKDVEDLKFDLLNACTLLDMLLEGDLEQLKRHKVIL